MNDPNITVVFIMTVMLATVSFMCMCLRMEAKKLTKIAKNYKEYYEKTQKEMAEAKIELFQAACRAEAILRVLDEIEMIEMEESKNDELSNEEKNMD